ncbi:putative quorum-quenching lactonase YtnP [Variibacter gotjawalensis]|uniref:Putative quorum-quenching lactonase YtnP n=1 Tax=Variibacter gotjawalensis TaxID=1333996 RepID=A0A0S3PVP1_9BRAD|nr:MBL fold metallo-hydrolase [Variibacter gotjawalensis]NIK45832.1 glyoxylase-like metal-dependent hydrolase (beta-lactamase superfamily II) [Variibacter gotjawalensis]RZS47756.1 glyoxylase-like metal-dependent hydrolase (beta-lactamase superfamily II) [Variibacter gotjawalensis]BAT60010.1 putative quorum-quenching lactonase YtnP [Variibacter gotjawalensis]
MQPIRVGDVTIHRIVEQEQPLFDAFKFFPDLTPEILAENAWLTPRFITADHKLNLCVQSYLVQTPHHNILIDTCVGNHKPRPAPRQFWDMLDYPDWERNFAATGLTPNDIDFVMCTHLHIDHVGWNTKLDNGRWVPTFPKARYLFSDRELAYWTETAREDATKAPWMADSVLPIVSAGQADQVKSEHQFSDLVSLFPTPGHTIDHFSVRVGREGADAIITGDMVHSPLQVKYPEFGMFSDYDSKQAGATRRKVFAACCDTPTLVCTAHFPSPSTVRIKRDGDGFKCVEA